ncbi:MAG: patatin-like phospholipase family protein [Myxococcota bacterium]
MTAVGLALALTASAPAQSVEEPTPVALVVSGGVSLGSYQAGFLYYLTEVTRRRSDAFELSVLTGTSAGSINAVLSAIASCRPAVLDPRDSLFYQTWLPVGFDQLYVPDETTARSAFSRRAFAPAIAQIRDELAKGLRAGCTRTMGFTTTRITPERARVGVLTEVPYSEERFTVILRGAGYGLPPALESIVLPGHPLPQPVLPLGDTEDPLGLLLDVVYASSAFPLAFEPVSVPFCSTESRVAEVPPCTMAEAKSVELIDGALFDNTPLRLAVDLSRASGRPPGPFALLPTDALAWPRPVIGSMVDPEVMNTLGLIQAVGQGFVETAQQSELRVVVEQYPDVLDRLSILRGVLPSHGETLFAFGGFFERGFREADFVQGMAAAHLTVREAERVFMQPPTQVSGIDEGRSFAMTPELTADRPGWRPFDCLVGLLDGDRERAEVCRHTEVAQLRPLFQVAFDRLYAECVTLRDQGMEVDSIRDPRCRDAMLGGRPPLVPGLPRPDDRRWRRAPDEDWLAHQLRRLYAHGFRWADEGLGVAKPNVARRRLRDRLAQPALALAKGNAAAGTRVVRLLAELGLNQLSYAAPQQLAYVGVGTQLEAGWSFRVGQGSGEWLRVGSVVAIDGLVSPFRSGEAFVAVTPLLELQLEPVPLSTALFQPRLGVQLGYRFSSLDGIGAGVCEGDGEPCTQPTIRFQAGLSLAQRLRAQFGVGVFPARSGAPTAVQLLPQFAVQFPIKL